MKAVICTKYGPPSVLSISEVSKPTPGNSEVLIRIAAFPITTPDRRIRGLNVPFPKAQWLLKLLLQAKFGFTKPKNPILGNYLSGRIVAIGKDISRFHVGDEVIAYTGNQRSTYAEYICLSEGSVMVCKPSNLSFEQSAAIPYGFCNALYFLNRAGGVKKGQSILIYGASGAIGSSAVQLAKQYYGAEVTGVCSGANAALVRSLGADCVIDYTKDEFADGGTCYDLIFDAVGKLPKSACERKLNQNGKYVTVFSGDSQIRIEDFALLKTLIETGKLKPVVDRCYPIEQIVDAHSYADQGHTKGVVVVKCTD